MSTTQKRVIALIAAGAIAVLALTGCGAGSRTGNANATEVECDYEAPDSATTVNVLAYNSSAIDPFTDTMVSSCTKDDVTVKHDPIDFGGQVTKTTATLAGDTGTYDILETYGFVIPGFATDEKLVPLDDLFEKYADDYDLDEISESMRTGMSYDGKLYAIPMQAQMFVMAYRADVFEDLGLDVPTTFPEMIEAAEAIKAAGLMEYPIALPWLATADVSTSFQATMNSLGADFATADGEVTLDTPEAQEALEAMLALKPYMDPQVTTFDQPKVQQQMYNGTAAMSIMFSGRMNDLTLDTNSQLADSFAFAAPPKVSDEAEYALRPPLDRRLVDPVQHEARPRHALRDDGIGRQRRRLQGFCPRRLPGTRGHGHRRELAVRRGCERVDRRRHAPGGLADPGGHHQRDPAHPDGGHLGQHLGRGRHGADAGRRRGHRRLTPTSLIQRSITVAWTPVQATVRRRELNL